RAVVEHGITFLHFPPSMLSVFLQEEGLEGLSTPRQAFTGGEVLTPELRDRFFASPLGHRGVPLHNGYGPTETSINVSYGRCEDRPEAPRVALGRPIANLRLRGGEPGLGAAPLGVPGELWISGGGLARGYLGRPDLTADRFVPDPFAAVAGERSYRTGDRVRTLEDGRLEFLGRIDQQVKIRGFRVELEEIEAALRRQPEVAEAAAAVLEDGRGERQLVGYVVAREGAEGAPEGAGRGSTA